ncbi:MULTISPECIES: hypothetical protein [unclassified Rhizobacter]|uniref:hypothetical protein n=1 Tax=unclassified Rhizobacter TaxID=2640088 RepID=UPI0006FAFBD3|nr:MULTISPECIES: hypothetical protein [unclassified Rhizobacter]KQU65996.1 hypothetical protein ASC88_10460 [Rhizobacter sp. Root29]KRB18750.1 hypothetical protein ASE08_05860 [Rhizobacter sp. Root16D2]
MKRWTQNATLFIDAGSTVSLLAEELASLRGLTVVTNSFDVSLRLATPVLEGGAARHDVHVLGGRHGDAGLTGTRRPLTRGAGPSRRRRSGAAASACR